MSKQNELVALARTGASGGGNKNLIINGAMTVSQRGNSTGVTASAYCGPDRFQTVLSSAGTWSVSQSTTNPAGFANSLKYDCTTADASLSAGDYLILYYKFEGQDLQHLKKGTADAKKLTLSFWIRSNKTGTYQVNLYDNDNARNIGKTYTIDTADTWEHKTLTFDGDTTGTFDNNTSQSMNIEWWFAAGSNFNSGSVPTSWEATADADRAAGLNVNLADSTSNELYITGVQLEVGEKATDFEHRSYGDELFRCQRYYEQWDTINGENVVIGTSYSGNNPHAVVHMKVIKRAAPTVTLPPAGISTGQIAFLTGTGSTTSTIGTHSTNRLNTRSVRVAGTGYGGISSSQPSTLYAYGGASSFKFDAEL